MKRALSVAVLAALAACLTTYNSVVVTPLPEAPTLSRRAEGCHVDVFEDGQKVTRPHLEIGRVVLEWPLSKLKEQGAEGAIQTLKTAACESGAFILKDMRALTTGDAGRGMIYEATLATLLGDDGKPLNLVRPDAGPADAEPATTGSAPGG